MSRLIDASHQGLDRVIGVWEVGDVVVDPGPEPCMERMLAGLERPPRALLLTHIHLDHAGAAGALVRRDPDLRVYLHELGAPHLVDPSKLLRSAGRLYGDEMERLWGEVVPVPECNIVTLSGGENVEGFRVAYTPGHASHHVAYLHEDSGDAFVGDVGGVRIPPSGLTVAPTPPPDIDLAAWERSLQQIADWDPNRLCLTHYGPVAEVGAQLDAVRQSLGRWSRQAGELDHDAFLAAIRSAVAEAADDEVTRDRYELAVPPEHIWLGLRRWLDKRAEAAGQG